MRQDYMEWAYETMVCGLVEGHRMPGVEHAFSGEDVCMKRYGDAMDAYERLCQRLGVVDEDQDVESIFRAFMDIERELCYRMYACGAKYGMGSSVLER